MLAPVSDLTLQLVEVEAGGSYNCRIEVTEDASHGLLRTEFRDHIVMEKLCSRNHQISAFQDQIITLPGPGSRDLHLDELQKRQRGCHNDQETDFRKQSQEEFSNQEASGSGNSATASQPPCRSTWRSRGGWPRPPRTCFLTPSLLCL